ncbi:MAG: class I SAM-dependent methyltransferase [Actinomycetota bacterium]|nr:class I SAM-dependent methyltransferase [Actinomycetota bacterium]
MAWWEDFFDESYVQIWTASGAFEGTDQEVDGLVQLLGLAPGAAILDVACGFGRIAGPLHQRGYRITGIDLSEPQLRLAEERNPGPTYLRADMRRPPAGPFDAVLNVFSSFGYFDDPAQDAAALRAWRGVLRPGGALVMTLMHRDRVAYLQAQPREVRGPVREEGETDWVKGVRTATVTYRDTAKNFRVRLYTVTELVGLLRGAGFGQVAAYGDLWHTPVSPATRLVLHAIA